MLEVKQELFEAHEVQRAATEDRFTDPEFPWKTRCVTLLSIHAASNTPY